MQGEVGSRNDADVELRLWEGVCDMKRPAWNCVFQLKDEQIYQGFLPAHMTCINKYKYLDIL